MNINKVQKHMDITTNEIACYKVTLVGDEETLLSVPLDPANRHYQGIQEWGKEGNKIEEAD